ncbi:MAG: polysaccharide biosynthesis/export family protein [Fidelibacterota bacterium]
MKSIYLTVILGLTLLVGQNIPPQFGRQDLRQENETEPERMEEMTLTVPATPLEKAVNPDIYVLGPGDKLGIDIITGTHMFFQLYVNPGGDILIPSVGKIMVGGTRLTQAIHDIQQSVTEQYKNSKVSVSLLDIRQFVIPVTGAIKLPGDYPVFATQRVWDVIDQCGGFEPFTDPERVQITHADGSQNIISLKAFLLTGDLSQNPVIREGDHIHIPILAEKEEVILKNYELIKSTVWVTGFVEYPGSYQFIPGLTLAEYIALAGGAKESGSAPKATIKNRSSASRPDAIILAGDRIYVPETVRSRLIGNASTMQIVTAFASIYLTYIAATK